LSEEGADYSARKARFAWMKRGREGKKYKTHPGTFTPSYILAKDWAGFDNPIAEDLDPLGREDQGGMPTRTDNSLTFGWTARRSLTTESEFRS